MADKKDILERYVTLARKLGKFPTKRESSRFGLSSEAIYRHFDNLAQIREEALKKYPELDVLVMPAVLKFNDVENYRLGLEKNSRNKSNTKLVTDVSVLDYVATFAENVFKGEVKITKTPKRAKALKRTHTLVLSDLHFGADLSGDETGTTDFKATEESRRFAAVILQAASYKVQYRKNTKLVIALLGDVIENALHDKRTGATVAEQVCRAIHLLVQGIAYLASHYPEVQVECATGNHDRNTARHQTRAIHQKFDSMSTMIYYALKTSLRNVPNVKVNIPKTPLSSYEVYGKKIGYTHGDTVINPGNPYKSVNVARLENQVNKINAALPDKQEFAAILYGHTHLAHIIYLPNGTILIGNGGLPPADHFGVSMGSYETNNGQWIFESVPGYPVGDLRLINVNKDTDKDETLDNVIKPWRGFNE